MDHCLEVLVSTALGSRCAVQRFIRIRPHLHKVTHAISIISPLRYCLRIRSFRYRLHDHVWIVHPIQARGVSMLARKSALSQGCLSL